jgi:hypothetical protein
MSMKGKIGLIATMAAIMGGLDSPLMNEDYRPEVTHKEPPIPKGCKKYVYKESFGTLEVIAMNEKSAMKKYNKWCEANAKHS